MIRRISALLMTLAIMLCIAGADAQQDVSLRPGTVNDEAAVLSDATARDVETLNRGTVCRRGAGG